MLPSQQKPTVFSKTSLYTASLAPISAPTVCVGIATKLMTRRNLRPSTGFMHNTHRFLGTLTLLTLFIATAVTSECTRKIDSSSMMFGAGLTKPFNSSWVLYEQETQWRNKGDITRIDLYYDEQDMCIRGVKPTYGPQTADASRLGSEGTTTRNYVNNYLTLQANEVLIKAEYRYSIRCIEFLRLTTSRNRQLTIGNSKSQSPLLTSRPVGSRGAFLAFFKGYTDSNTDGARKGLLQQLQIYWVQRTCSLAPRPSLQPLPFPEVSLPSPIIISASLSPLPGPDPPLTPAKCTPAGLLGCKNGRCPSSSCPLSGLGGDVPMLCYGQNPQVFGNIDSVINPCTNLACKLDVKNCTTKTPIGLGGACTGRIMATSASTNLHPIGSLLLNYPCIEDFKPLLELLSGTTAIQEGIYMSKGWKACGCSAGLAAVQQSLGGLPTRFNFTVPDLTAAVTQLFVPSLPAGDVTTAIGQWLIANTLDLPIPQLTINEAIVTAIRSLLNGNFTVPSLIIPETSATLLSLPSSLAGLPVYQIPTSLLSSIAQYFSTSSLATLLMPSSANLSKPQPLVDLLSGAGVSIPALTIPGIKNFTASLLKPGSADSVLTDLLSTLNLPNTMMPLSSMTHVDLLSQLLSASRSDHVPVLSVMTDTVNAVKALIPGFTTPSVLVANITAALLQSLPQRLGAAPVFVIPDSLLDTVSLVLTNLSAVPTLVQNVADQVKVPPILLSDFNITGLITTVRSMALDSVVPIPGLPSPPTLRSLLNVDLTKITNMISQLQQATEPMLDSSGGGTWMQLLSSLSSAVSAVLPQ